MVEKKISFDHSITEQGSINIRKITRIFEDGVEISKAYHRHIVSPGDDVSNEDERTKLIAGVIHTKEIIEKFKTSEEELN